MEEKKKAFGMAPSPSYEIRAHHGMCLAFCSRAMGAL